MGTKHNPEKKIVELYNDMERTEWMEEIGWMLNNQTLLLGFWIKRCVHDFLHAFMIAINQAHTAQMWLRPSKVSFNKNFSIDDAYILRIR